jgi:hypothetical protein
MGTTTVYAIDEIPKDAHELTKIAIKVSARLKLSTCSIQLNMDRLIIGQWKR